MSELEPARPRGFQPGNTYGKGRPLGSRNLPPPFSKETVLKEIHDIYVHALGTDNLSVALQALSIKGKIMGLYRIRKLQNIVRIEDMNEGELEEFMARLEEHDPSLKMSDLPRDDYKDDAERNLNDD